MHFNLTGSTPPHPPPEADISIDTILQGAYYHDPWTIVRVKRSLNTGDNDDVIIGVNCYPKVFFSNIGTFNIHFSSHLQQGSYKIGWAYSDTNNFPLDPHVKSGLADHIFIP